MIKKKVLTDKIYKWLTFTCFSPKEKNYIDSLIIMTEQRGNRLLFKIELESNFDGGEELWIEISEKTYKIFAQMNLELANLIKEKKDLEKLLVEEVKKINEVLKSKGIDVFEGVRVIAYRSEEKEITLSRYDWSLEEDRIKGIIVLNILDPHINSFSLSAFRASLRSCISQIAGQHIVLSPILQEVFLEDKRLSRDKLWERVKDTLLTKIFKEARHSYLKGFQTADIKFLDEEMKESFITAVINTLAIPLGSNLIEKNDYITGRKEFIDYMFKKGLENLNGFLFFQTKKEAEQIGYRQEEFEIRERKLIEERPGREEALKFLDELFSNLLKVEIKDKEEIKKEKERLRWKRLTKELEEAKKKIIEIKDKERRSQLRQILNNLKSNLLKMNIEEAERRLFELKQEILPKVEIKISDEEFNEFKQKFSNLYLRRNGSSFPISTLQTPKLLSEILNDSGLELKNLTAILEKIIELEKREEDLFIQRLGFERIEIFSKAIKFKDWEEDVSQVLFEFGEDRFALVYRINLKDTRFGQPNTKEYQERLISLAAQFLGDKRLLLSLWRKYKDKWFEELPLALKEGIPEDSGLKNFKLDVDKYTEFGFDKKGYKQEIACKILETFGYKIAEVLLEKDIFHQTIGFILQEELKYSEWVKDEGSPEAKSLLVFELPLLKVKAVITQNWGKRFKPFMKRVYNLVDRIDEHLKPEIRYLQFFETLSDDCIEVFKGLKIAQRIRLSEMLVEELPYKDLLEERLKAKMKVDKLPEILDKELFEQCEEEVKREYLEKLKKKWDKPIETDGGEDVFKELEKRAKQRLSNRITYIRSSDPKLAQALERLKIDPQVYDLLNLRRLNELLDAEGLMPWQREVFTIDIVLRAARYLLERWGSTADVREKVIRVLMSRGVEGYLAKEIVRSFKVASERDGGSIKENLWKQVEEIIGKERLYHILYENTEGANYLISQIMKMGRERFNHIVEIIGKEEIAQGILRDIYWTTAIFSQIKELELSEEELREIAPLLAYQLRIEPRETLDILDNYLQYKWVFSSVFVKEGEDLRLREKEKLQINRWKEIFEDFNSDMDERGFIVSLLKDKEKLAIAYLLSLLPEKSFEKIKELIDSDRHSLIRIGLFIGKDIFNLDELRETFKDTTKDRDSGYIPSEGSEIEIGKDWMGRFDQQTTFLLCNTLEIPFHYESGSAWVEYSLNPSLYFEEQIKQIDCLLKYHLIPKGLFSLHISLGLPNKLTLNKEEFEEKFKERLEIEALNIAYPLSLLYSHNLRLLGTEDYGIFGDMVICYYEDKTIRIEFRPFNLINDQNFQKDSGIYGDVFEAHKTILHNLSFIGSLLRAEVIPPEKRDITEQKLAKLWEEYKKELGIIYQRYGLGKYVKEIRPSDDTRMNLLIKRNQSPKLQEEIYELIERKKREILALLKWR